MSIDPMAIIAQQADTIARLTREVEAMRAELSQCNEDRNDALGSARRANAERQARHRSRQRNVTSNVTSNALPSPPPLSPLPSPPDPPNPPPYNPPSPPRAQGVSGVPFEDGPVGTQEAGPDWLSLEDEQSFEPSRLTKSPPSSAAPPPAVGRAEPAGFAEFWEAFPKRRRTERAKSAKLWARITAKVEPAVILAGLARWNASKDWAKDGGEFTPMPATWLNGRRWEDDPEPDQANPAACLATAVRQFVGQPWYGLWSRSFDGFQDGDRARLLLQQQQERGWRPDEDAFYRALDADDVAGAMAVLWDGRIEVAS